MQGWGRQEKGNTVKESLRSMTEECVEVMQGYGVLSQSLLSSMEVFPLTYTDTEQGSTRMSLCL